jgi:N-acetylglucosaminyldiphosphoundecaprenol N-acetyl-beta-D-mannosaminyltransferase
MSEKLRIISLGIHHLGFKESLEKVMDWAEKRQSAYVCFANVHMIIEAYKDKAFPAQVEKASLVLADGKPVASACKILYHKKQERIAGMDFMPRLLEIANERRTPVFFYGSTQEVLEGIKQKINLLYPSVIHAGSISPSFGVIKEEEMANHIEQINNSGAQIIFVSLGCPKQERWMATHSEKINGVLLGVGAAFPVMAGLQKRAPVWMQNLSLEWVYRLWQQPRRLFKRYFFTNLTFLYLLVREWVKIRLNNAR